MRLVLLLLCLAASLPGSAANIDTYTSSNAQRVDALRASPDGAKPTTAYRAAKPARLASPEDYEFDHLLRCAVGCQG